MLWLTCFLAQLFSLSQCAIAAPIPPKQSIFDSSAQKIRVLIGHYPKIEIKGFDLQINGKEMQEGQSTFHINCEGHNSFAANARGNFLYLNGNPYRGKISIYTNHGTCSVVNELDLEKYIAGLLNTEMHSSWPIESLKAQAVASRTYAFYQKKVNQQRDFDLEGSTQDQVYFGAVSETPKTHQATESTKGIILSWKHEPIKAFFHANCGGHTENPEAVWGEKFGYLKTVLCPYHKRKAEKKQWSALLTLDQIDQFLHKASGLLPKNFARLAKLESGPNNDSQRLSDLIISDYRGNTAVISANAFRNAMGNTRIKSTAFVLKSKAGLVEIHGEGYGHGVGMCQSGAKRMAEVGHNFVDILHFYYPLAKLERLQ